ncbi:MAG: PAS domain S-box protein [Desulfitobacteriaceae bacterium]
MQITKRVYFSVIGLIVIPVAVLAIIIPVQSLHSREEHRSEELYFVAALLESRLPSSYDEILKRKHALDKTADERGKVLNQELQPIIDEFSHYYPDLGLGYYSIELDRVLAVGPNFTSESLKPIPHDYPFFRVYETGRPEITRSEHSIFRNGAPILNLSYPIYRNGKIIGHTWANIKIADIYWDMWAAVWDILLVGAIALMVSIFVAWRLFNRLSTGLKGFADALVQDIYTPTEKLKLLPELSPVLGVIKQHTDQILTAYAKLQEEVSVREMAEGELRRSHDQISNILESITDAYIAIDPEWRLTDLNREAEQMTAKTREELIGIDVLHGFPVSPAYQERYRQAMTERQAIHFEEFSQVAGKWLETHLYPSRYGLFVYFHDISDRKKAEEALRLSEERFSKAFNSSPSMMCIVTFQNYRVIEANDSFLRASGWTQEEVIGHTIEQLELWSCVDTHAETIQSILAQGIFRNFESLFITRAGQVRTVLVSAELMELRNEQCVLIAMTDITDHKQLESEMLRLDRLNLLGEMAAGISHEIRNPLTTIRGFLQMLKAKPGCEPYEEYYTLMIEELDRANSIITEFLSIGRNQAGEGKVQSLNRIVNALAPLIQADAVGNEKTVILELGAVPDLLLNEKEIRQIVLNLARNGLEAMRSGGTLTLKTFADGNRVVLAVQDQGEGISRELLDKLGTPFLTTKEQGTGLGLAVCYGIALRHNAHIMVETGREGTTFFVSFECDGET